ncbi:MAG: phosphotransferase [Gemmatimonadetes bacterium]|nr:phosphotransferase [Gemmatimonadota bacterium]
MASPDGRQAPWAADRDLGPQEARAAIEWAFPEVEVGTVQLVGSGWEFDVYRVRVECEGTDWAFRFPRRREYSEQFDDEAEVLRVVARTVAPIRVPSVELRGAPGPHFPYSFAGHRFIEGIRADAPGVALGNGFAETLGATLARLHASTPDDALRDVLGLETEGPREWLDETLAEIEGLRGFGPEVDAALGWLEAIPVVPAPHGGMARVIHNDLCPDHLLVDGAGDLCGIIDWTDAAIGDPLMDFVVLYAWKGRSFVEKVLGWYELRLDPGFWERLDFSVRVRALHWLRTAAQEGGDVSKHRRWVENAFAGDTS